MASKVILIIIIFIFGQRILSQTNSLIGKYYSDKMTSQSDRRCKLSVSKDSNFEMEYEDDGQFSKHIGTWQFKNDSLLLKIIKSSGNMPKTASNAIIFLWNKDYLCPALLKTNWCCVSKKNAKW